MVRVGKDNLISILVLKLRDRFCIYLCIFDFYKIKGCEFKDTPRLHAIQFVAVILIVCWYLVY